MSLEFTLTNTYTKSSYYSSFDNKESEPRDKKCIITIGKCSRLYLYILASGLFKLISLLILGDNNITKDGLGLFGFCPILYNYNFIQSIFIYTGYIIFGLIFFYFKGVDKRIKQIELMSKRISIQGNYIHNKGKKITKNTKLKIFLVCLTFVLHIEIKKVLYLQGFQFFNFWTVEIILMQYLMNKYFTIDFYIHHKVSIIFNVSMCSTLLLIASFLPTSLLDDSTGNSYQNIEYKLGSKYYCILFILFFIFLSYIYAFSRTFSKVLMQIKFFSPYKLIIYFGITGLFISLLSSIIAIFINYPDNISEYYSSMKLVLEEKKYYRFYAEIFLVSPLYAFSNYMEMTFEILTIYYLNPFYILMTNNVYYIINELISFIINFSGDILNIIHFVLAESSEFFAILGYMVYLEILELNFCGLSKNLKQIIIEKGEYEFKRLSNRQFGSQTEEENDADDEKRNNSKNIKELKEI